MTLHINRFSKLFVIYLWPLVPTLLMVSREPRNQFLLTTSYYRLHICMSCKQFIKSDDTFTNHHILSLKGKKKYPICPQMITQTYYGFMACAGVHLVPFWLNRGKNYGNLTNVNHAIHRLTANWLTSWLGDWGEQQQSSRWARRRAKKCKYKKLKSQDLRQWLFSLFFPVWSWQELKHKQWDKLTAPCVFGTAIRWQYSYST